MSHKIKDPNVKPLWTHDFTIITLGSVVSMLGNSMSGFAISLMVLDYTQSTLMYALYLIAFTVPQFIMPIFSGAILDRFSRKKAIYTIDFISAGLYAAVALILNSGWFSFPVFAAYCFILGSINSIYAVAYESFYPLLITEGNYSKAYSIASVLETLSALMVPVATFVYKQVGIAPLLGANACTFLIAAIMETRIRANEEYIDKQKATRDEAQSSGRQMLTDIRQGFRYLTSEKGLLAIAIYFTFSSLAGGASGVITLPYFKNAFTDGEYVYMVVWGMALIGRSLGGLIHYRFKLPTRFKFAIAFAVYILTSTIEGWYLYMPVIVMMILCFCTGLLGVTSYTIRISATQSYVPDELKGRFNGAFNMLNTVGSLSGELFAGLLTGIFTERTVLTIFMMINALAAIVFIGGNRKHVKAIYNTQQ